MNTFHGEAALKPLHYNGPVPKRERRELLKKPFLTLSKSYKMPKVPVPIDFLNLSSKG
jgi:hypothetical protein